MIGRRAGGKLRQSWPWLRRTLMALVVLASCIYLWLSFDSQVSGLEQVWRATPPAFWPALAVGSLGTLLLGTAYHVVEVRRLAPLARARGEQIALAYALGQLARYIPGKVIGVIFQVKLLEGKVPPRSVVLALVVQTMYDYAWAIAFCAVIIWAFASGTQLVTMVMVLAVAVLAVWHAHAQAWCERTLLYLFPKRWSPALDPSAVRAYSRLATILLALVWVPLLAGLVAGLHGEVPFHAAVQLGCYYILASMASLLVIVVPSGIALREALFVWLGREAGAEPAMLVFLGIAIRICLTGAEIGIALFFAGAAKLLERRISSRGISP